MQLTREHFDKAVKNLATQQGLDDLSERIDKVEKTLEIHTKALDELLQDLRARRQEKDISIQRLDRLEQGAQQVGEKLGVKIEL